MTRAVRNHNIYNGYKGCTSHFNKNETGEIKTDLFSINFQIELKGET